MNELKSNIKLFIRNCLSNNIWNKQFLIFLFFFLLSGAFWLFQALNETYKQDFSIPVKITNVPEGVIITTEPVSKIETTLRDRGVTLINYKYGSVFKPIIIDYNAYANASGHVRIMTKEVLRQLSSQVASSTQIITTKPDTIEFYYNHGLHKRVPVVLEGKVKVESGYALTHTKLSEDSVTVYASSSLLDDITAAHAKVDYLKDVNDTTKMRLNISPIRGAKFIPDNVNYEIYVDRLVEKKVHVPIMPEQFPNNQILLPIPQEVEVSFQVGMGNYRNITAEDFVVVANYKDLVKNGGSRCPLRIRVAPNNVSRVRITPNKVEYVIEKVTQPEPQNP